jgi:hypothetical protein
VEAARDGAPGTEILPVEHEDHERTDHRDRDQPAAEEGQRSAPAGGHAEQDDHGHYRDRAREGDRQPERRNFGD